MVVSNSKFQMNVYASIKQPEHDLLNLKKFINSFKSWDKEDSVLSNVIETDVKKTTDNEYQIK